MLKKNNKYGLKINHDKIIDILNNNNNNNIKKISCKLLTIISRIFFC